MQFFGRKREEKQLSDTFVLTLSSLKKCFDFIKHLFLSKKYKVTKCKMFLFFFDPQLVSLCQQLKDARYLLAPVPKNLYTFSFLERITDQKFEDG